MKNLTEVRTGIFTGGYNHEKLIVTNNAISFGEHFQIITKWTGSIEEIVGQFDFMHNMCYFRNGKLETLLDSYDELDSEYLRYNQDRARDICGTIMRIPKFVEKGFKVTKSEIAKMLTKLEEVGFDEREHEIIVDMSAY